MWHHESLLSLLYSSSESRSNQKAEEKLESRARQEKAEIKNSVDKRLGDQNIILIASKQTKLKNNENEIERLNEELQIVNNDILKLEMKSIVQLKKIAHYFDNAKHERTNSSQNADKILKKIQEIEKNIEKLEEENRELTKVELAQKEIKKQTVEKIEKLKKANMDLEIDIEVIRHLRNHDFRQFKQDTKSPSTFAGDKKLWKEHVGQFFVDDNIFDDHKNFIPGLFIHPAFQQLCKENINPVEEQTYDDDLHAITKSLFDLDPFSCKNESDLQKIMIKILNLHNRFVASSENFSVSTDKVKVRTDISISKNGRKICLIELKHLLLHVNSEPIYQIGAYYSNRLNEVDYIDKFTFPMLLLAIVGNQYFVYGGINYNKKIQVFFINSFSTNDRNSFHTLYQIIKFLANTKTDPQKWHEYEICDEKYKQYPDFVKKDINIISENKQVFLCDGKLYKFSPSYCSAAHDAMDSFAPKFMREFKINGEFMIEMEYLEGYEVLTESLFQKLNETEQSSVLESLVTAIKTLHAQGYVHGDIRLPNIMVKKQNEKLNGIDVKIVDFEFAGKSGAVYYPRLNRNIQWGIEDTKKSKNKKSYYSYKKITFHNDVFMLKAVIDSLSNLDKFTNLAEKLSELNINKNYSILN